MKAGDHFRLEYSDGWDELLVVSDSLVPFDEDDEDEYSEFVLCLRLSAVTEDGAFSTEDLTQPGSWLLFRRDHILELRGKGQTRPGSG